MDIYKKFGTNQKLEKEGIWVQYDDETALKIARWGNPHHKRLLRELAKPYQAQLRNNLPLPEQVAADINLEAMAGGILVDWKGIEANGEDLPYTTVSAKTLLAALPDLERFVSEIANNMQMYQREDDKEAEKNSERSSSGS